MIDSMDPGDKLHQDMFLKNLIQDIPTKTPKDGIYITWTMDLIRVHPLNHGVYHLNFGIYHQNNAIFIQTMVVYPLNHEVYHLNYVVYDL